MPGPNPKATGKNIAFYMREGRPRAQAVAIAMSRRRQASGGNSNSAPNPSARARQMASPNARFNRQSAIQSRMGQNPDLPPTPSGATSIAAKRKLLQAHPAIARRLQTATGNSSRTATKANKTAMSLPKFESMKSGDLEELKRLLSQRGSKTKKTKKTGPNPSPRAIERANQNARFKRGQTTPDTRREALERMRSKRKKNQARKGLSRLAKRGIPNYPRGTQS